MCLSHRTVNQVSQAASASDAVVDVKLTRFGDNSQESGLPVSLDSPTNLYHSHTNGNTESDSEEEKDISENQQNGTNEQDMTVNGEEEADTAIVAKKRKTRKHLEVMLIEISLVLRIGWGG